MRIATLFALLLVLPAIAAAQDSEYPSLADTSGEYRDGEIPTRKMIRVSSKVARVQTFTAEGAELRDLQLLVKSGSGTLNVEIRRPSLRVRLGRGTIAPTPSSSLEWRSVEWLDPVRLKHEEKYAIVMWLTADSSDEWGIGRSLSDTYPWGEFRPFEDRRYRRPDLLEKDGSYRTLKNYRRASIRRIGGFDLGFRAIFDTGAVIQSELTAGTHATMFRDDIHRPYYIRVNGEELLPTKCKRDGCVKPKISERDRDEYLASFSTRTRTKGERLHLGTSSSNYLVSYEGDRVHVLDASSRTSATYTFEDELRVDKIFDHLLILSWDSHYLTIDLRNGARFKRNVAGCEYAYTIRGPKTPMVACLQDDQLTLHELTSTRIVRPPLTPEIWRFGEPFWVGEVLHYPGQGYHYSWEIGATSWTPEGPGASMRTPSEDLARLLRKIQAQDPDFPGFNGTMYYSPHGWRYDLQEDRFRRAQRGVKSTDNFTPERIRYGSYLLNRQTGDFHKAPVGLSANWVGTRAVVFPENCPVSASCHPLDGPFDKWVMVDFDFQNLPVSHDLGFEPVSSPD